MLGSFSSCRLATQWIASYVLLYRTWHLQHGKTLEGDEGVGWNCLSHSVHLPAGRLRAEKMERMSSNYCMRYRAETITEIGTARRLVLARLMLESTMGHSESQIGYLANDIKSRGGDAPPPALTHRRRVLACAS